MKKIIAMLILAALCLSLFACDNGSAPGDTEDTAEKESESSANSEADEKYALYEKYDALLQLLESEKYKEAIMEIYELAEVKFNDNDTSDTEAQTEVIEITKDNWQDYFEIALLPRVVKNDFDEPYGFHVKTVFQLKDEWKELATEINISVEYSCTGAYHAWFNYDIETQELVKGDDILGVGTAQDMLKRTFSVHKNSTEEFIRHAYTFAGEGHRPSTFSMEGTVVTAHCEAYSNVEINRIQGTLTVTK